MRIFVTVQDNEIIVTSETGSLLTKADMFLLFRGVGLLCRN